MLYHEVLVIGAGLAGQRAALEAHGAGIDVGVLSKLHPMRSHSVAAQGGINAALREEDSPEKHLYDTVKGSDFLADQDAVEILTVEGPRLVIEMEHLGTIFDRNSQGQLSTRQFGGAGFARTIFSADRTGLAMMHSLYEQMLKNSITVYEEWQAIRLVALGENRGVITLNLITGELDYITAKSVVIATGPAGMIYSSSTNSLMSTGDGIAMAYRAGAVLKDMEFIQFHPTSLIGSNILITEGARAEGGYLINNKRERFMKNYAPQMMELAPRDIVTRAIMNEIREGRGFRDDEHGDYVELAVMHLGEERIRKNLSEVTQIAGDFAGIDPVKEPIKIVPAQHFIMGGISTDVNGSTNLRGVYAAGECACLSVHGANRLGGNALLECLVFGRRAGRAAAEYAKSSPKPEFPLSMLHQQKERLAEMVSREGGERERVSSLRRRMQTTMNKYVGVYRSAEGLSRGLAEIREIRSRIGRVQLDDRGAVYNTDLTSLLELEFMLDLAEVMIVGALGRQESRGAHFREDFPKRDDKEWLKHTLATYDPNGPILQYAPVKITKYPPEARRY